MKKLLMVLTLVCGCSSSAEQAVGHLKLVKVRGTDLCFAITGSNSDQGGVAMVEIACEKIPVELTTTVNPSLDSK